ncbi:ABC transporter substrate-binding protein [Frigoribacterium sp. PhB24]|uniref:sugar ABC transporter substrate-binding protein n=1 Tax=Frigoribacterium sp. PhB24 TaxID=2485204 RepID=UPI000F49F406|nr:ABC transporter substrate-binding protein [Frigoribacterium sp. PhB24]ROS49512.1 carbohydrate ABC transporter substrate-binding protein (CUT1 family) [Frigoribacterium sp. PhB24]
MKPASIRRRSLTATALVAVVPLVLAGCTGGGGGASTGGEVTKLTVVDYYGENDEKVITSFLDTCGTENGVEIERTMVPGGSLIQRVLQQASSRTLPDVLMLDNPDLAQIAETGALAPLSDFGLDADGYAEGVVQSGTYDGKLYGLAPTVNTIALFYDKSVLADAGIEPPATWDELESAAKALTSGDRYGMAVDANATYEASWQFLPFMWSNGADEKDIATPESAEALQLWTDLVADGSMSKSVLNWTQADVNDQFIAGKTAMMVNGPWQLPALDAAGADYGVVTIPVKDASDTAVTPLGGEVWTVPQTGDAARQAVAAKVVACMNSDENQLAMAEQRNTIPSKTSVADTYAEQQPDQQAFVTLVASARSRTAELGAEWPTAATAIYTAIQAALTGQASPEKALDDAQASN